MRRIDKIIVPNNTASSVCPLVEAVLEFMSLITGNSQDIRYSRTEATRTDICIKADIESSRSKTLRINKYRAGISTSVSNVHQPDTVTRCTQAIACKSQSNLHLNNLGVSQSLTVKIQDEWYREEGNGDETKK